MDALNEGDFDDFAAAIGQGGDGSDDDSKSDDFMSWLLVHADTIDPRLEDIFDSDEGNVASVPSPTPAPASATKLPVGTPGGNPAGFGTADAPRWCEIADGGGGCGGGGAAAAAPAPAAAAAGAGEGVSHRLGDEGAHVTWQGSPLFPSDPVLAMQMGARLALTGNLDLIPFVATSVATAPAALSAAAATAATGSVAATTGITAVNGARGADINTPALLVATSRIAPPSLEAVPVGVGGSAVAAAVEAAAGEGVAGGAAAAPPVHLTSTALPHPGVLPTWAALPHPPQWLLNAEEQPRGMPSEASSSQAVPANLNRNPSLVAGGAVEVGPAAAAEVAARAAIGSRNSAADVAVAVRQGPMGKGEGSEGERILSGDTGEKRPRDLARAGTREVFRDGRKRKRMSLGELEERVKQVAEDNSRLKLHLSNVNEKLMLIANKKKSMEAEIAAKLEVQRSSPSDSNQASLEEALGRFKDLYADYGKHRKQEVDFHLKQLERQIVPTDTTKMSLWTLEQDESFYKDRKRGSLSVILRTELGVSEEQIERIQERRARIKRLLDDLGESLRLVRELHKSSEAKHAKFEEVMARLQSAFSPQQIARLLLWVSANRAHISNLPLLPKHMLQQQQQQQRQRQQE